MPTSVSEYVTKELSLRTWPDLEKLFQKPEVGDAWWCWCMHHHVASYSSPENKQPSTRAERAVRNRRKKRELIEKEGAHGILVYTRQGEPVGWCQYGPREELPRTDHTNKYRNLAPKDATERLWRVTCFVVDKEYRRRGVASAALKAALEAIRKKGGGLVEAFPVSETDQGPGYMCTGRLSMFNKAGFKKVAPFGIGRTKTVMMRRTI